MTRPRGRPPKAPQDRRVKPVTIHLTPSEWDSLRRRAAQMGLQPSRFARLCSLERPLPPAVPEPNRALWRELGRLGGLLNQWLHAVHSGAHHLSPPVDLHEVIGYVAALRNALVGKP